MDDSSITLSAMSFHGVTVELNMVSSGKFRMCKKGSRGSGGKAPVGDLESHQKLTLFVNGRLNFDVLEEKNTKTAKIPSSKIRVG